MHMPFALYLAVTLFLMGPANASTAEVEKASSKFYEALNTLFTGNIKPMQEVWSHASDVTYMGPDGTYLKGWEPVEKKWATDAAAKLGGEVHPTDIRMIVGKDLAVITCIEKGNNIIKGKTEPVEIRASTTFRKEGQVWKVVGHQTDMLSYLKSK